MPKLSEQLRNRVPPCIDGKYVANNIIVPVEDMLRYIRAAEMMEDCIILEERRRCADVPVPPGKLPDLEGL